MTKPTVTVIIGFAIADLAHPVERHLAKVKVASSSLVIRSIGSTSVEPFFFLKPQKPTKGTVPFVGFLRLIKIEKSSIYAPLSPIKPTIGTVPLVGAYLMKYCYAI